MGNGTTPAAEVEGFNFQSVTGRQKSVVTGNSLIIDESFNKHNGQQQLSFLIDISIIFVSRFFSFWFWDLIHDPFTDAL